MNTEVICGEDELTARSLDFHIKKKIGFNIYGEVVTTNEPLTWRGIHEICKV